MGSTLFPSKTMELFNDYGMIVDYSGLCLWICGLLWLMLVDYSGLCLWIVLVYDI